MILNDTGKINQIDNNGAISFINVNFSYNNKPEKVLLNINLDINPNMTLAIVGKSGCGKSTLVNLIPRFYSITEGEISIGSANINDISLNTLRKHISYVGQNTILFNDTIFNNITYGENTVSKDIVEKALKESSDFPINWESFTDDYLKNCTVIVKKFLKDVESN